VSLLAQCTFILLAAVRLGGVIGRPDHTSTSSICVEASMRLVLRVRSEFDVGRRVLLCTKSVVSTTF
jgi:hypothetical protein